MIRIIRTYPAPATLRSKDVKTAASDIRKITRKRKPLSSEFPSHWGNDDVRSSLWQMQHHKCCYCERKREKNRESDIEHFRPKAEVTEADSSHMGYWWLAYIWENLLFSCRYCNQQFKKNHFPIPNESKRAHAPSHSLDGEEAFLIDPVHDDPERHICFDWYQKPDSKGVTLTYVRDRTEKGRRTIEIAGLNGGDLPVERGSLLLELEALATLVKVKQFLGTNTAEIKRVGNMIRKATSSTMPFAAFRRDFFRKNGLGEFLSSD